MSDDLLDWFAESDGFAQGTKAPHKWVLQAEQEIRWLQARVAELEAAIDISEHDAHMWRFWSDKARELATKNAAAEALLSEAVKAGMMEGVSVLDRNGSVPCSPMYPEAWSDERLLTYEAAQMDAASSWKTQIRALASDPETIASIVAQVKEGRG